MILRITEVEWAPDYVRVEVLDQQGRPTGEVWFAPRKAMGLLMPS